MQGLGLVQASSGLPGSGVRYTGDLSTVQKQPLAHKGRDNRFQEPIFDTASIFAEDFDFAGILRSYNQRNCELFTLIKSPTSSVSSLGAKLTKRAKGLTQF